jgi:hypothetical protein
LERLSQNIAKQDQQAAAASKAGVEQLNQKKEQIQKGKEGLDNALKNILLGKISGLLGENKSGVTSAVGSALPSILLGLMQKGSELNGAASLIKMLQEGKHDGGILDNLGNVLGGGTASKDFISSGKNLFGSLFGDKAGGITDLIASASGISKNASSSLLGMLAPIVMGFLGKTLKAQGGLNLTGLTNLLLEQKDFIKSALPSGLTQLMGVTNLDSLGRQAVQTAQLPRCPGEEDLALDRADHCGRGGLLLVA